MCDKHDKMMQLAISAPSHAIHNGIDDSMVCMSLYDEAIIKTSMKDGVFRSESIPYTHFHISKTIK